MSDDREHKVRERAYALWETEGRPSGRHEEHWHRANSEFPASPVEEAAPAEPAPPTAAKPKQPRRKPVAASPAAAEAPSAVEATTPAPRKRRTLKPKAN